MKWIDAKKELPNKHGFYRTLRLDFDSYEDFKNGNFHLKEEILEFKGNAGDVLFWKNIDENTWNSFEDTGSPLGEIVLCCDYVSGFVSLGIQKDMEFFDIMHLEKIEHDVIATHWMPLPKPPKYEE